MTTITVTYGRKQPGSQEYSSENLCITLTQELGSDAVEDTDVRNSIDTIYELLREEVERRLCANDSPPVSFPTRQPHSPQNGGRAMGNGYGSGFSPRNGDRPASQKQVNYLLGLATQHGFSFEELGQVLDGIVGKRDPHRLTSREAGQVIDALKQPRGPR